MVESADLGQGNDAAVVWLDSARLGCILSSARCLGGGEAGRISFGEQQLPGLVIVGERSFARLLEQRAGGPAAWRGCMFFSNQRRDMLALIGAIIVIAWLLGLTAFHVTGGLIHLALVVGLVLVVLHFLTGRTRSAV
jgi:hypothetical protein